MAEMKLQVHLRHTAHVYRGRDLEPQSGHALKPGDTMTAANGKTIEVNNTDAGGRPVLADCLVANAVRFSACSSGADCRSGERQEGQKRSTKAWRRAH
jgi:leucyl aminopeptidase